MSTALSQPLRGIVPPLVTPLASRDDLDHDGLSRLVEHVLGGGVHGLFILGTTGEAPSLSHRLRRDLIDAVTKQVNGRVPILVGITDTSFVESVEIAGYAAAAGAAAVVLAPPYYFPAGQPELLEYLRHLVKELPLPLFLYNMPSLTKLVYEPETVREAAAIDGIVGLKDSSADMIYFHHLQQLCKDRPEFSLLVGPETLLGETLLLGGHGGVCGGANLRPQLYVELYAAAQERDLERVRGLHAEVMRLGDAIYGVGRFGSSYLKGLKCALSCCGICSDFMAEPFHRFREEERETIAERLRELGITPAT